ncbi:MAG: aldehyde dehydrogenase family protein [Ilumatobacter sp.]|nr:MAG: aldehyde dehydrogenase family protein [Ilumatobacter sp.]
MKQYRLLIGGEWVDGAAGTYDIVNPATEEVVGAAPEASVEQAHQAAAAARRAFPAWAATPAEERGRLLAAVARRLAERQADLIPLVTAETGATSRVSTSMQLPVAIERFERYARAADRSLDVPLPPSPAPSTPLAPGGLIGAVVNRQPVGVVACISPYNFPVVNMAGKIAPALAVGCTVVMKPAPQDPLAVIELAEVLDEVGFPPGVINVITSASPDPAAALTTTRDVDMVSFTGSTAVGERIYEAGAPTMKRLLLELGGKGAAVVLDDADLGTAVTALASVWGFHSGQICTAPTRAVVHRSRVDELVSALTAAAGALPLGDPTLESTIIGPVISAAQRDRIERAIQSGVDDGATLVLDGRRPDGPDRGFYVGPTLITDCTPSMSVARDEIFGPVISVLAVDDDDEAVAVANGTAFGLYDYVFSADTDRAYSVARRLRSGNVGINTAQRNHETPFGGFKMSGIGRDGGDFGLLAYTEMQSIVWKG